MKASLTGWHASNLLPIYLRIYEAGMKLKILHCKVGGWPIAAGNDGRIIRACTIWKLPSQAGMHPSIYVAE